MRNFFMTIMAVTALLFQRNVCLAKKGRPVPVFGWYNEKEKTFMQVAEGEFTDAELIEKGWSRKIFLFCEYRKPKPNSVAVNLWYHTANHAYVSVAESEFTDKQMKERGYTNKHFQYYLLIHKNKG